MANSSESSGYRHRAILATLLRTTAFRHWRQAPGQALLVLLTIALGTGVFTAIRLANRAAVTSFHAFTETLTGESQLIVAATGSTMPVEVLTEIRDALGPRPVHLMPVLETTGVLPQEASADFTTPARTFQFLGLDLIGLVNLPTVGDRDNRILFQERDGERTDPWTYLRDPRALYISPRLARTQGLSTGDPITFLVDDAQVSFTIAGLLPEDPSRPSLPETVVVMDIAHLQDLVALPDRIERIEVRVEPGRQQARVRGEVNAILAGLDDPRWRLQSGEDRREAGREMTRAFRLNLLVLSLIALIVGLFLVIQALDAAVVRRRAEIATLRALGVEAGTILQLWLLEAVLFGILGGILGVLLGWIGAQGAVHAVARTVNALYQSSSAEAAGLTPTDFVAGLCLATMASALAGWIPARDAADTPPAQILVGNRIDRGIPLFRRPWIGFPAIAAGFLCLGAPALEIGAGNRFPLAGYVAAFLWILGAGILGTMALPALGHLLRFLGSTSAVIRIALSRLRETTSRHRLAAAGLIVAVGMASAMALLIGSFETTMGHWIRQTLRGDLYVAAGSLQSASSRGYLSEDTWLDLAADPAVETFVPTQIHDIVIEGAPTYLVAEPLDNPLREMIWLAAPEAGTPLLGRTAIETGYASEGFARRFQIGPGSLIAVPTPTGPREVMVEGIYAEYGNERGSLLVDFTTATRWFDDRRIARASMSVTGEADPEQVRLRLSERHPSLIVRSHRQLRADVLRIFRQTFSITYALQVIAIVVAVAGLGLALVSLALETRRDLVTLRSIGMSRSEIARVVALEGVGISAGGIFSGLILGFLLGFLLIYVINRQAFGWTLSWSVPVGPLLLLVTGILASGLLVSYAVGRWAARLLFEQEE